MRFEMPGCGGCRTCELACGYRHTGEFKPSASSMCIMPTEDQRGYHVLLHQIQSGTRAPCDGCQGLETPLCVEYCREADDLTEILRQYLMATRVDGHVLPQGDKT